MFEDADFRHCTYNDIDKTNTTIFENTTYKRSAEFDDTLFNDVTFTNSTFYDDVSFQRCQFNGDADFADGKFSTDDKETNFQRNHFAERADFRNCIFSGVITIFDSVQFDQEGMFANSSFKNESRFSDSIFADVANFYEAKFDKVYFQNITFNDIANFQKAKIYNNTEPARFQKCVFSEANYKSAEFNGFPDSADFSESQFNKKADFLNSTFNGTVKFDDVRFLDLALFESTRFKGEVYLNKTSYDVLLIRWKNMENGIAYNETAYSHLIQNLKSNGLFNDANSCYYSFMSEYLKELRNDAKNNIIMFLVYSLSDIFYGFGTKPELPIYWSIFFIIFFWWKWWYSAKKLERIEKCSTKGTSNSVSDSDTFTLKLKAITALDALGYSTIIFLSGTKFFVDPPKRPSKLKNYSPWYSRAFIAERILGGIFSLLFFIAISKSIFAA